MTTYDYRALCVELTDCLEKADWPLRHRYVFRQWIDIARAALADGPAVPEGREPAAVTGEPSDEELNRLLWYEFTTSTGHGERTDPIAFARAVLARWGHQPAPPADGEVAELTAWLRMQGEAQKPGPKSLLSTKTKKEMHANGSRLIRAAELLQRRALPEVGE